MIGILVRIPPLVAGIQPQLRLDCFRQRDAALFPAMSQNARRGKKERRVQTPMIPPPIHNDFRGREGGPGLR